MQAQQFMVSIWGRFRVREGSGLLYLGRDREVIFDKNLISDKYLKMHFDDENNNE